MGQSLRNVTINSNASTNAINSAILTNVTNVVESNNNELNLERENINGIFTNMTLLSMVLLSLTKNRSFLKPKRRFKEEYDYIIVGAGTAGSVLANRLSEKPCVSVLLLEIGGVPPILTEVPAYAIFFYNSRIDWAYKTTPQKYTAFSQKENRIIWNNGKALGGSSILNAMLYVRGNKRNYDEWEAEGATGWSYDEVFPYFLKLEDNRNIDLVEPGYHRVGGPMTVEDINYIPEIKKPILQSTKDMGYEILDINGSRQTGIYKVQATLRNQQRCSTYKAYLEPAKNRPNLDIVTKAYARKILINETKGVKRAYGVEFDHGGATHRVRARKEVIISSGTIKTPQILMLSGIGPKEHLEKLNITVVANLPVGKNLMDHVSCHLICTVNKTITPAKLKILSPFNMLDYLIFRRGPLTAPSQMAVMAFLNGLNTTNNTEDFPRYELHFGEYDVREARIQLNLDDEVYNRVYRPYERKPLYICFVSLLQPYSRGEITLNSTNPYDVPNINPNYHEDERDVKDIVEGLKICNAVAKHPRMRQVQAQPLKTFFPACEEFVGNEDKYFTCMARQVVNTFWHYSGTARMGHKHDPRSVVDPQLRVIGVEGLRVVNAAIFPKIPSGNTNVPTMMVAEKASDMIKEGITCEGTR